MGAVKHSRGLFESHKENICVLYQTCMCIYTLIVYILHDSLEGDRNMVGESRQVGT